MAKKYGLKPSPSRDGCIDLLTAYFEKNNYVNETSNPPIASDRRKTVYFESIDDPFHPASLVGEEAASALPAVQNPEEALTAHTVSHSPSMSNTAGAMPEEFLPKIGALLAKHQQQMMQQMMEFLSSYASFSGNAGSQGQSVPNFIPQPEFSGKDDDDVEIWI